MKILISKYAGFCGGVKAAVLMLERALRNHPHRSIKVLGELVHNKDVNRDFMNRGVKFIQDKSEAETGDLVFIRAHGAPETTYEDFKNRNIEYVDATCYKVKNTQDMIITLENEGWQIAIFGEEHHPETIGLVGHTRDGFIINRELLKNIKPKRKVALLVQSTSNRQEFQEISEALRNMVDELYINPTFCDFTVDAQADARSIRNRSEVMLVIGGENSSNTVRLQEICAETIPSYHIQNPEQIKTEWFNNKNVIGITAGASTPTKVIENVVKVLESYGGVLEEVIE
jgi:4-hydroxy-3-methylbut-2-enyl diphosphate reductase